MEKQGFRFFILRILAHRLQNWADFLSRQVGEAEWFASRERASGETIDTGNMTDTRVASSPESDMGSANAENPPADWLKRASAAAPPTDWLARVQKDAPALLMDKVPPSRVVPKQSPSLSAPQAHNNEQIADTETGQETPIDEIASLEEMRGLAETSTREEGLSLRHNTLPSVATVGNTPLTDVGRVQGRRLTKLISEVKGKPAREEVDAQQGKSDVPVSILQQHEPEGIGQGREPARISEPDRDSTSSSQRRYLSQTVKPDSSPWEGPGINAHQKMEYSLWSQTALAEPQYDNRWPEVNISESDKHIQAGMRWPSLPEQMTVDEQDWEAVWRAWERQQRLDKEQRGG